MDSKLFCDIIAGDFVKTLKEYDLKLKDVTLQQDNDPKHTSGYTQAFLKKRKIHVLDWPSYSPDMNPIENLWFILKCKLAAYDRAPKNLDELYARVKKVWRTMITPELCVKLIESMPRRIEAVIKAKGGQTKY